MNLSVEFKEALKLSLPSLFAYFPLGIVFGVLCAHSGFYWWLGPLMSAVLYAGAAQFVALSMMQEQAGIAAIIIASVFISFRNSFYGLNLLDRFNYKWYIKWPLIFMLVDSTYVSLVTNPPRPEHNDLRFCLWLSILIYAYWVVGTLVGAVFSRWIPSFPAVAFILPAFFMVLIVEYFISKRRLHAIIAPLVASIVAYLILPSNYLMLAIIFSLLFILSINKFGRVKV